MKGIQVVLALAALGATARADRSDEALRLLNQGGARYNAGDYAAARPLFAAALQLAPERPNPYRMLGLTDARLGRCADAVQALETFLTLLKAPDDPRIPEAIAVRDRCRAELQPRVGTLVVDSTPAGAEVRIDPSADTAATPGAAAGVTPFRDEKVAPGEHRVALRLAGFAALAREVTVRAGETVRLELPLTPLSPPTVTPPLQPAQALPDVGPASPLLPPAAPPPRSEPPRRTWLWALVGVGAAGAVAAGITLALLFAGPVENTLPAVVFP